MLLNKTEYKQAKALHPSLNFLLMNVEDIQDVHLWEQIREDDRLVLWIESDNLHAMPELRRIFFECIQQGIQNPIVIKRLYEQTEEESLQVIASTEIGGLLIDGLGDGVVLGGKKAVFAKPLNQKNSLLKCYNQIAFGILQAARTRITKTEYISCPSCGRTLFDLQETTAMIRQRTDHLKGVKIGIMGCIVNGPGEMADADYGYVGSGKGKITLYRGKQVVKRAVPSEKAVDELIELIKEDGNWKIREK